MTCASMSALRLVWWLSFGPHGSDPAQAQPASRQPRSPPMSTGAEIDGVLVQWGERLFYPGNRIVRPASTPRLSGSVGQRAAAIRQRIAATVVRRRRR